MPLPHAHAEDERHSPRGHPPATHGQKLKSPAKDDPYARLPGCPAQAHTPRYPVCNILSARVPSVFLMKRFMRPTENSIHAQEANPHIKPDDQAFYAPREKRVSEIMQAPRCG